MTKWNIVWNSHMEECTRWKIITEMIAGLSFSIRLLFKVIFVIFVLTTVVSVWSQLFLDTRFNEFSLYIVAGLETLSLFFFKKAKDEYLTKKFTVTDASYAPPEDLGHQQIRYMKFRRNLKEEGVSTNDVSTLLDILSSREEFEKVRGYYSKKLWGVLGALLIAILLASIRDLDSSILTKIFLYGSMVSVFVFAIASLVPATIERINELRYFLKIFSAEQDIV